MNKYEVLLLKLTNGSALTVSPRPPMYAPEYATAYSRIFYHLEEARVALVAVATGATNSSACFESTRALYPCLSARSPTQRPCAAAAPVLAHHPLTPAPPELSVEELDDMLEFFDTPTSRQLVYGKDLGVRHAPKPYAQNGACTSTDKAARLVAEAFRQSPAVPGALCGLCNTEQPGGEWCDGPWGAKTVCAECSAHLRLDNPYHFLSSFKSVNGGCERTWEKIYTSL